MTGVEFRVCRYCEVEKSEIEFSTKYMCLQCVEDRKKDRKPRERKRQGDRPPVKCTKCDKTDPSQFRIRFIDGNKYYVRHCKECEKKENKEYYDSHKVKRKASQKKYRSENADIVK